MTDTITLPEKDTEHERILAVLFDLSPAQAAALSCLCRMPLVSSEDLLAFTSTAPPIKVAISRTREKLRTHKMDIDSKPGVGYWMAPEHREQIAKMIDGFKHG